MSWGPVRRSICRNISQSQAVSQNSQTRTLASIAPSTPFSHSKNEHKVIVIGGGTAGLATSHQLLHSGKFATHDIAIIDPATYHDYQPGWTLVGGGLKRKEDLRRPMSSLIDSKLKHYHEAVAGLHPEDNSVSLSNGDRLTYQHLVVAPGIKINIGAIPGLAEALANPDSLVSSIYSYEYCDKVFPTIEKFKKGNAIFTLPSGALKCAGAPQKVMWLALDKWKKNGLYMPINPSQSPINISFATALQVMFGVPKYSQELNKMREERGVEGLFGHDLVSIENDIAVFKKADSNDLVKRKFDLLHAVPRMGPHDFVKNSVLANEAGFVKVDTGTLQHKDFPNVWSLGDASDIPTSKTAAAITAQAPVLVQNLLQNLEGVKASHTYDGYTSCPLLTEYGKVMLAEFKYDAKPKETFGNLLGIDQAVPRRAFYHLKKDFFPWVYYNSMVKGTWAGPKGWSTPS